MFLPFLYTVSRPSNQSAGIYDLAEKPQQWRAYAFPFFFCKEKSKNENTHNTTTTKKYWRPKEKCSSVFIIFHSFVNGSRSFFFHSLSLCGFTNNSLLLVLNNRCPTPFFFCLAVVSFIHGQTSWLLHLSRHDVFASIISFIVRPFFYPSFLFCSTSPDKVKSFTVWIAFAWFISANAATLLYVS